MKNKGPLSKRENSRDTELLRNDFFLERVSKKFIINSVISMVFLYAGSLIDTLIVGLFLGERGLSAMSLISPVYLVYYTIGAVIGIGSCIAASRYLGNNNINKYRQIFTLSTYIMIAVTIIMTVLGYALLNPISNALSGGSLSNQYILVREYLKFYIIGGGFNLISYIPLYFLKIDGRPEVSSRLFAMSAVINIILSWIFINPKIGGMGIGGASLATTLSLSASAFLGFFALLKGSANLKLTRITFNKSLIKEIILAGIPNGLSNLLESARILMINMLLLFIGAAALLPCYTVVRNVSDLLYSIIAGISSALIPIFGVFYGEHDYVNERSVFRLSYKLGLVIITPLVIIGCFIPKYIFSLFGVSDPTIINEGIWALPLSCIGLVIAYINTLYTGYLTSIKRENLATVIVVLRLFATLAVFAIPLAFTIGPIGIWASLSLAEIATLIIFLIIRGIICRYDKTVDKYFLNTSLEQDGDIVFSVKNDINDIVNASEKVSDFCTLMQLDIRRSMRAGNAIEEILTVLIKYCLGSDKENYVDVRLCKLENEVLLRFRYIGKIFDPVEFLHENSGNEDMETELLGITMIEKTAKHIDFKQTLGSNTLVLIF